MGKIYVIGGTDAWICLNSVEIYDPELKKWQLGPQLNIARRGAGCDVFNGEYVILYFVSCCFIPGFCILNNACSVSDFGLGTRKF